MSGSGPESLAASRACAHSKKPSVMARPHSNVASAAPMNPSPPFSCKAGKAIPRPCTSGIQTAPVPVERPEGGIKSITPGESPWDPGGSLHRIAQRVPEILTPQAAFPKHPILGRYQQRLQGEALGLASLHGQPALVDGAEHHGDIEGHPAGQRSSQANVKSGTLRYELIRRHDAPDESIDTPPPHSTARHAMAIHYTFFL